MLIDLPCSQCGRSIGLSWSDYLDAVASDSQRRNWPYVCRGCRSQSAPETQEEKHRC